MFKSNVEVNQPMASAGGDQTVPVKKVIHPKVSVVKEEPTAVSKELTAVSNEPAFTLPSDSKIID